MRTPFFVLLSAIVAVSIAHAAPEKGGVRDGGSGIFCEGKAPELLDLFLMGSTPTLKETHRKRFIRLVTERVSRIHPDFAARLEQEWNRVGDSRDWETAQFSENRTYDEYLPFDIGQLPGCKIEQISAFSNFDYTPSVSKNALQRLSSFNRRVLELHEALYIIGTRDYRHKNPIRVRHLVAAILSEENLAESLREFMDRAGNRVRFNHRFHAYFLAASPYRLEHCPSSILIEDLGYRRLQIAMILPADGSSDTRFVSLGFHSDSFALRDQKVTRLHDELDFASSAYSFHVQLPDHSSKELRLNLHRVALPGQAAPAACEYHRGILSADLLHDEVGRSLVRDQSL